MGPGSPSLSRGSAGTTTGSVLAEPTCGCGKRSSAPIHCFRIVIYNRWRNSNVSGRQRAGGRRSASPGRCWLTRAAAGAAHARIQRRANQSATSAGGPFWPTKPGGKTAITIRPGAGTHRIRMSFTGQPASCSAQKKAPAGWPPAGVVSSTRHASIKERCRGGRGCAARSCPDPGWRRKPSAWPCRPERYRSRPPRSMPSAASGRSHRSPHRTTV